MKLLLLSLLLFNVGIFCYGFNSDRIMNGGIAPAEKYHNVIKLIPYLIVMNPNVTVGGYPFSIPALCTGTLISKRHILTAAHCITFPQEPPSEVINITFLEYRPIKFNGQQHPTIANLSKLTYSTNMIFHKGWHWQNFQDDLAIITLPANVTDIEPVLLAKNYQEGANDIGINVGYGDMDPTPNVSVHAKSLMEVVISIMPADKCYINNETHPNICAGNSTHRVGQGDSGGPLFFNAPDGKQYQIGITHDGVKDGKMEEQTPDFGAFMRISAYCPWIEEKTNGEAKCVEIGTASRNDSTLSTTAVPPSGAMSKNIISVILLATVFAFVF